MSSLQVADFNSSSSNLQNLDDLPKQSSDNLVGPNVVELKAISKSFGTRSGKLEVLKDVSLVVGQGELISIVGPSGCGKTTLLRILQGLETASSGSTTIEKRTEASTGSDVGFVFQQPSLLPWWTVRKNVEFGLRLKSQRHLSSSKKSHQSKVDDLLDLVGLSGFGDFLPSELSGGMQQRANLARALAIDPTVLLLDEPFSSVDAMTKEHLQLVLSDLLTEFATTAILVTHDIREAIFLADRVVVMSGRPGKIVDIFAVEHQGRRDEDFQHSLELAELQRVVYRSLKDAGDLN